MKKRFVLTALVALAVFGVIFGLKYRAVQRTRAAMLATKPQPVSVSVAAVREDTWPNTLGAVGSLASFRGLTVKSELAGTIRRVLAESGAVVAAGDALVELDTSVERAQLSGLEAQAKLAEINLRRAQELRSAGTNTPNDLDTAEAVLAQTRSAVDQLRATIAKKHIVAPFPGRLGIVKVFPGQFLAAGDPLVVLETIDPIHVDFSVPQQELARIAVGLPVRLTVDAWPGRTFEAKLTAISPRVSDGTRDLDLRATVANPGEALRPGMYARVEVVFPATERALVLAAAAVVHNPYGESVYVVEADVVHQRFIKTGPTRGDLILVRDGLKAGEQVVTSGQIKLRNGSAVHIDNSAAPLAEAAPQPPES
jgi:membrane fusion protein (multidrug efflux system)